MWPYVCPLRLYVLSFGYFVDTQMSGKAHDKKYGHIHREKCRCLRQAVGTPAIAGGGDVALSDAKLRALKPADKIYQVADEGGLSLVIHPGGTKT